MADLGGSITGFIGKISGIFGLFKGLSKSVAGAIAGVGLQIVQLGKATASVFSHVGGLLANTAGFFNILWRHVINPALFWIVEAGKKFAHLVKDFFAPVIKLLMDARKQFLKYYNKFIRPITDTIDVVRRTFRVLGLLGVDSAKSIDRKLAQIEAKIQAPMFLIVSKINEVLGYVNSVVDGFGLFSRLALINSMLTYKHDVVSFGLGAVSRPLTEDEERAYRTPGTPIPIETHLDDMRAFTDGRESWVRVKGAAWAEDVKKLRAAA